MIYIVLIVIIFREASAVGPRCLECTRIPFPRDCDHVRICGDNQVCFVEQLISDSGFIYYNTGCQDKQFCTGKRAIDTHVSNDVITPQYDETGDLVTCKACCHSEFCNTEGCGAAGLPTTNRGPMCFSCPKGNTSPDKCDKVTLCSTDQSCSIQPFHSVGGDLLYRSGCSHTCHTIGTDAGVIIGKRAMGCSGCCNANYCNGNCETLINHTLITPTKSSTSTSTNTPSTPSSVTDDVTVAMTTVDTTTLNIPTKPSTTSTTQYVDESILCSPRHPGYVYFREYHHCVKIYNDVKRTWSQSRDQCIKDGGNLLKFRNKTEEIFFESITEQPTSEWDTKRYWVGASDLQNEKHWMWMDNTAVNYGLFFPNEPNNGRGGVEEDCGATAYFNKTFLLNDDVCDNQYHFICEIPLAGTNSITTTASSQSFHPCRNSNYHHTPGHDICFHVYDDRKLTMEQARQACWSEHADLLVLPDKQTEQLFLDYNFKDKENNDRRYWIGGAKLRDGTFHWINGRPLDNSLVWAPGQPDNYNYTEECLDITWFRGSDVDHTPDAFSLNDDDCKKFLFYICEETRQT